MWQNVCRTSTLKTIKYFWEKLKGLKLTESCTVFLNQKTQHRVVNSSITPPSSQWNSNQSPVICISHSWNEGKAMWNCPNKRRERANLEPHADVSQGVL